MSPTWQQAKDLTVGAVVLYPRPEGDVPVTILREKEPAPNPFGLPWFRYWCRNENTGKEGFISYGPGAQVRIISD